MVKDIIVKCFNKKRNFFGPALRTHSVINALSFLLLILFVASCALSAPSERDGQALMQSKLVPGHKIVTFKKTNGQAIDGAGVKGYRMFYEATTEFMCDSKAGCQDQTGKYYYNGEIVKFKQTGSIIFEKSEKGWVNGRFE